MEVVICKEQRGTLVPAGKVDVVKGERMLAKVKNWIATSGDNGSSYHAIRVLTTKPLRISTKQLVVVEEVDDTVDESED